MIGCYDFCAHYEWTFAWLDRAGGHPLVRSYWDEAINHDSQRHARDLIRREGIPGMLKYWGHTLVDESPSLGFTITHTADVFRVDMHDCPSKGFLLRNGLENYRDYCDHCMGWTGPMLRDAGFTVDHEHNHRGQCWSEIRPATTTGGKGRTPAAGLEYGCHAGRSLRQGDRSRPEVPLTAAHHESSQGRRPPALRD
jgi:hypothetical protein